MNTIRKLYHVDRAAKPPTLEGARFIASTAATDRYGDVVDQATWKLDNYRLNPVIQVDHDYDVEATVGRGAMVDVIDNQLVVDIVWGKDLESQAVAQKVQEGLISAVSVGFRPGRLTARHLMPENDPYYASKEDNMYGVVYYDCELLEISVVAVPANPQALAQRSAGVNLAELIDKVAAAVLLKLDERKALAAPAPLSLEAWLKGAQ